MFSGRRGKCLRTNNHVMRPRFDSLELRTLLANAIVLENQLPGNPPSDWNIVGAGDASIQGFATNISVDQGQVINFKVRTDATDYRLDVYRLGYYGGLGARKVATIDPSATLPQSQPNCLSDSATGLIDCGNWGVSASWTVPATATSGIYFAKLVREDGTPGSSHIVFVVRDDDGASDLLFQTSDTTWQAYNDYGGNSLYVGSPAGRAYKVSYNRPFNTATSNGDDWLFHAEYPMIRWLEGNGYDVSYSTGVDSDRRGAELLEHDAFLSVGHDEYWSGAQRTNVEAARAAGVNIAFFSGNEIFWKTRWEPTIDGSGTAFRTLVSYKETNAGAKIDPMPNVWTGTWRDPRLSPPADGGRPENALSGTISTVNCCTYPITVPEAEGKLRFWRNTSIASLSPGQTATLPPETLGYEWDEDLDNGFRPPGLIRLSSTTVQVPQRLIDYGSTYAAGTANHALTLYRHSSGALVFSAGTVQWSWGLAQGGVNPPDIRMQQASVNLLADMRAQPTTLQAGLVAATMSTDVTAPTTTIVAPSAGAVLSPGLITVSGTANDVGGRVAAVEVSVDGGLTWHPAVGRASWTYSWNATKTGSFAVKSRAVDDSGNLGNVSSNAVRLMLPDAGPGGPILIVSDANYPFGRYYAEILSNEGLNEYTVTDITLVTATRLTGYDVVILGEMLLSPSQVTMFTNWVNSGGNLISMRPDKQLAPLLGLTDAAATLSNAYLRVDTLAQPGTGIVNQTIQYHGVADKYTSNGATVVATLFSNASVATANPAVTMRAVGTNGGQAAAFTYDLARSIVYTRQGNPSWSGQERDGVTPIRSNDLFFGAASFDPQPDWIDLNKVAIPQADEQQRLLANIIGDMNRDKKPLPRFWYFPNGEKAVVLMTGDDHGTGGTAGRFDAYMAASPPGGTVDNWGAIRSSSYIVPVSPLTDAQLAAYNAQGFEVGVHPSTPLCADFTSFSNLDAVYASFLAQWRAAFPSLPSPTSSRTHCLLWSDYSSQPAVEAKYGIRLDTNYYYWPGTWLQNRPGLFTGSGMPMRFATADGMTIDVYQAATQMTDESSQGYPLTVDSLLDAAIGPQGYYGVFTVQAHTDFAASFVSDAVLSSALLRGVPIVSGRQVANWLDGRNNSSFAALSWNTPTQSLQFTIAPGTNTTGLQAMVPTSSIAGTLTGIRRGGVPIPFTTQVIKGVEYAFFSGIAGAYSVQYGIDTTPPFITAVKATANRDSTVTVTWTTDEPSNTRVDYGVFPTALTQSISNPALATSHTATLSGLASNQIYYFRMTSADAQALATVEPTVSNSPLSVTTIPLRLGDETVSNFSTGTPDASIYFAESGDGELILRPTIGAEFSGTSLPSDWTSSLLGSGGSATVSAGKLTLDGAIAGPSTFYLPPQSLEFSATFSGAPFQSMGFGVDLNNPPWAIASTSSGGPLYARTAGTTSFNTQLLGDWLGVAHTYRIDWNPASVDYSIDGALLVTHPVAVTSASRPVGADAIVGDGSFSVNWLRMGPFAPAGSFISRIMDASQVVTWGQISWGADTPVGTTLAMSVRTGNTAIPDGTWSAFVPVSGSGATINTNSRYIQYRVDLASSNPGRTPTLKDVFISYSLPTTVAFELPNSSGSEANLLPSIAVKLSTTSVVPVSVNYSITGGSATSGIDYTLSSGVLSFNPAESIRLIPLSILNDTGIEPNETIQIALSGPVNATIGANSTHTYTIVDNDSVSVGFGQSSSSGSEATTPANLTVALSAATSVPVTVNYAATTGTATGATDYTLAAGTLTFLAGETSKVIAVSIVNDTLDEANETIQVSLSNPTNVSLGTNTIHTYTILDNDPAPTVAFAASSSSGSEGTSPAILPVTLSAASGLPVTVNYAVTGGTATGSGTDLTLVAGSLTFGPGVTTQNVSLGVINDTSVEANETVVVTLSGPTNSTLGVNTAHTYTILDDDSAFQQDTGANHLVTIESTSATSNVAQGGHSWSQISDVNATGGIALQATPNNGANNNANYLTDSPRLSFPVNFNAIGTYQVWIRGMAPATSTDNDSVHVGIDGQANTTADRITGFTTSFGWSKTTMDGIDATITVPSIGVHTVNVWMREDGFVFDKFLLTPSSAFTPMGDGPPENPQPVTTAPSISFEAASSNGSEATSPINLNVNLSVAYGLTVTANYAVTGGTASGGGGDYTLASGVITFNPGETSKAIPISIVNDAIDEQNETVQLTLSAPLNAVLGINAVHTFTINDNDPAPTVAFASANSSGSEATNVANLTVSLSAASGLTATVNYAVTGGTGTGGGVDYTLASGTLTFNPGVTTGTIPIAIVDDTFGEANETIQVTLSAPSNATLGATSVHTYTIVNDDSLPNVSFATTSSSGGEASTPASMTVSLSASSTQTVTVNYAVTGGTAAGSGLDFTLANGTLSFAPGVTSQNITLSIVDDLLDEANETIQVTLSGPAAANLGTNTLHTYSIIDNDLAPTVSFAATSSSGSEGTTSANLTVTLSAVSGQNVGVSYSATGGTASGGGVDYTLPSGSLSFAPGETSKTVAITITNDLLDEANETVQVTLASPTNATLGTNTGHTYTITDNDAIPTVAFATTSSSGSEATTSVALVVNLSAASGLPVTVNYGVNGGTATSGVDYTPPNGMLTFAPGQTSKSVPISVINDSVSESSETIQITLSTPVNATLGTNVVHTYTINDNDLTAFQQSSGADKIVGMEASSFDLNVPQGTDRWTLITNSGATNGTAMQTGPNDDTNNDTNYLTNSSRLDFRINFVTTGTHQVWIRGMAPATSGANDSIHIGLDGQAVATSDRITGFSTTFGWSKSTMDGPVATINVTTLGVHTLNAWMREDGFVLDRIVLTTNANYVPTGNGPAESPRAVGAMAGTAAPSQQEPASAAMMLGIDSTQQIVSGKYTISIASTVNDEERTTVREAIAGMNRALGPWGVKLKEASAKAKTADITVEFVDSSACGTPADGVLACHVNSRITILRAWPWYTGSSPDLISPDEYDLQTVVDHELGHAVGLVHSSNPNSIMYETVAPGVAYRLSQAPVPLPPAKNKTRQSPLHAILESPNKLTTRPVAAAPTNQPMALIGLRRPTISSTPNEEVAAVIDDAEGRAVTAGVLSLDALTDLGMDTR